MSEAGVEYLDLEDLMELVGLLKVGPVRDLGLLDSACARPRATALGVDLYPTIEGKAAALLHSLARNHALLDGNKRLAWLATAVFLELNGQPIDRRRRESAFQLVMDVAVGLIEADEIERRLSRPR